MRSQELVSFSGRLLVVDSRLFVVDGRWGATAYGSAAETKIKDVTRYV